VRGWLLEKRMPSPLVKLTTVSSLGADDCRLLVESVLDYAIFMLDPDGKVATWNAGAAKIKGYRPDEIIGQHFSVFYSASDQAAGKPDWILQVATKVGRVEDEGWRVRKDGTRFWANVVVTALRDESGRLRGFGKVTRDTTERKRSEDALRAAEERFHHLVDAVVDYAIYLLDPAGHVSTWNSGARRLKGYEATEILGKHFSAFYTPEDRARGRPERILELVTREGRAEDEGWRVRKDGTTFWANVVVTALRDGEGTLLGFAKVTRDLTAYREAEGELRRSEERFRLLVDNIGDYAIYMLDPDGRVATWNSGAQRLKGYSSHEIMGRSFAVFFPQEDVARGKPLHELEAARRYGRFEDEGWRLRKDGTRFWANAILTAVRDENGGLMGFAKITRDLSERREAEENERNLLRERTAREVAEQGELKLRESEERYRALSNRLEIVLEGVADGITVQDRASKVVFANSAAARLCGFDTVDEFVGATVESIAERFEILDEEGRPLKNDDLPGARVLRGEPSTGALIHVHDRRSGRHWWSEVRSGAVRGQDGTPELAVNIWHDVTTEHRAERNAHHIAEATVALNSSIQSDELLAALARTLVPGLADWASVYVLEQGDLRNVASVHSDPEKASLASEYHLKFPPDPNRPGVWNVVRSAHSELHNDISDEQLARSVPHGAQLDLLRSIGMKAAALGPITLGARVLGVIAVVSAQSDRRYDATHLALLDELGVRAGVALERAELFRTAKAAAKAAEEASRTKDEFLATVSHELRTPLNSILGWATLLKERVTDAAITKPIESIHRNARAQARIIEDILDVSRIVSGKFLIDPKPVDLVEIARQAAEVVRPSALAKVVSLVLDFQHEYCLLVADGERLQQVIWNLLSNAIKFTPRGGTVTLSVRQVSSHAVIQVTDTGKGIHPSFLPYVFDRFRQADPSATRHVGGLGLGLALVRHIVELHGGTVHASSDGPDLGATFSIDLPVRALFPSSTVSASSGESPAKATAPRDSLKDLRVLVVDDESDAREIIASVLEEAGAHVVATSSSADAVTTLERFTPHVILSDIAMPGEDGIAFIRKVRAIPRLREIPAIAFTAYASDVDRTRVVDAGFNGHVAKPVDPSELVRAIAKVLKLPC
jgi:PAS domain S-box-containing protein